MDFECFGCYVDLDFVWSVVVDGVVDEVVEDDVEYLCMCCECEVFGYVIL